jgi:aminopeptidase N
MTRDAEVATGDFLDLVLSGIGTESDIGVVQGVLRQLRAAIDQFAAPGHRTEYLERLADAMRGHALAATPGSDHQLAFSRAFAGAATTGEQLDTVQALLDGTTVWEGLAIDTDLRWFLLQRLVAKGRLEDDAIEREQESDDTATGRRQAAFARATRPTSVAKELAWADIIDRTDLPNAILEATLGGFVSPDQVDLLVPYRDRYFEALPRVWETRTMEMAQAITVGLYPMLLVDDETVAATDRFLARDDLSSATRRLVGEGRDGVLRAQRARARDAARA